MSSSRSSSSSLSCKSASSLQEAQANFDVVTSSSTSIGDSTLWPNNQATEVANSCLPDLSIAGELWSSSPDMLKVLSDLELQAAAPQPGGDYLQDLPTTILPHNKLQSGFDPFTYRSNHGEEKDERGSQDDIDDLQHHHHREGQAGGTYKKQSKRKQAKEPEQSSLSYGVTRKKQCSESRRRKRINAKLKSLQQLIPNSYKRDQASILEDAVKYIQSLKLQLDVILKSSRQNQLQAMYVPQIHTPMMNPAFGIGATRQFLGPSGYGSMVPPQSVQVASMQQAHVALPSISCPSQYFPPGSFPPPLNSAEHH